MQTELLRRLNDSGKEIEASPVSPAALAELLKLVESGQITGAIGKKVFATMFETGRAAAEIVAAEGLAQISDTSAIEQAAREVIAKESRQRGEIPLRQRRRLQVFRRPGNARHPRPGQSASRKRIS